MVPFQKKSLLMVVLIVGLLRLTPGVAAADKDAPDNTPLLEAVGGLSAAYIYQTHQAIGTLYDAKSEELYDVKKCTQMLQVMMNLTAMVDKQLTALGKTSLSDADKKSITQLHSINKLLLKQGEELKEFWETEDEEHETKYEEHRKKSETLITKVLGIKIEEEEKEEKEKE